MNVAEHVRLHGVASRRCLEWVAGAWGLPPGSIPPPELPSAEQKLPRSEARAAPRPARTHPAGSGPSVLPGLNVGSREEFVPRRPETLEEARIDGGLVDGMIWKLLYLAGSLTSQKLTEELCVSKKIVVDHVTRMKKQNLVVYTGQRGLMDFDLTLTDSGRERARKAFEDSNYIGAMPVQLTDYVAAIAKQSIGHEKPSRERVEAAFSDLLINEQLFDILGPAINSAKGMFLYGFPGNGKTSIAERITRSFGDDVWIPKALIIDGIIIKLFDLQNHDPVRIAEDLIYDDRWIKIRRPTILVGGELTMEQLEIRWDPATRICEAPLQLKSNCGTLVIDDFGRQKMNPDQLLNRWIVPLEKRYDFLSLPTGRKIQVPFDQLIIFSTNLEPRDLVDDAFLRRIPYKICVSDPSEEEFRQLFEIMCPKLGFHHDPAQVDYLINTHYWQDGRQVRPYRCCHPRDLLLQIRNYCTYHNLPIELREEYFDFACSVYFTVMA